MSDVLERVYKVFDPAPLEADEVDLYIDLDAVRGEGAVVDHLAQRIRLSAKPTCLLLTGHRGSGKSTELKRLQRELENGEKRFFVVFCEARSDLDLNDVDFPEVLLTLVYQLAKQLKERADISLNPDVFKDRWERFKKLLGNFSFEGVELDVVLLKITGAIKNSPDARDQVRKAMEPDTGNLLHAANDVIGEAKLELSKKHYHDVVILVDDLDKMVLREHAAAGCSTAEHLFINRHAQLSAFKCHTVYSMPLALAYSAQEQKIANLYGGHPPVIPMTRITHRPPKGTVYKAGMDLFRAVIAARLRQAGQDEAAVFENDKIRDRLIKLSGGQPRELMILIREAIIGGGLPIKDDAVDRAEREGRRAYARQLREEHWTVLKQVGKKGKINRTLDNDEVVREVLDSRAVLQYVNKEEWYGLNPLVMQPPGPKKK